MTKYTNEKSNFGADGPFFRVIREGLEVLRTERTISTFSPMT